MKGNGFTHPVSAEVLDRAGQLHGPPGRRGHVLYLVHEAGVRHLLLVFVGRPR